MLTMLTARDHDHRTTRGDHTYGERVDGMLHAIATHAPDATVTVETMGGGTTYVSVLAFHRDTARTPYVAGQAIFSRADDQWNVGGTWCDADRDTAAAHLVRCARSVLASAV